MRGAYPSGNRSRASARLLTILPLVCIAQNPPAHLRGRIFGADGRPAANLRVGARESGGETGEPWTEKKAFAITSSDGSFDLGPLEPGTYLLGVNLDFPPTASSYYRRVFYPGVIEREKATTLRIPQDTPLDKLRIDLPPDVSSRRHTLQVQLSDTRGNPVAGGRLAMVDMMWPRHVQPVEPAAGADGRVSTQVRDDADYYIWAYGPDTRRRECSDPKRIAPGSGRARVTLVITPHIGRCGLGSIPPQGQ